MWDLAFENMTAFLFVFTRIASMIFFNPLFERRNVPNFVRTGFILCLSLLIYPTLDVTHVLDYGILQIMVVVLKEVFLGFILGYIFRLFNFMLFFSGDLMDLQFGLSMAKVFDPGTNIQMAVSSNILNILFIIYIFSTNAHLEMIKIFATSFEIIPIGSAILNTNIAHYIISLFLNVFILVFKLVIPFMAAQFSVEIMMGILMKMIPQIHVFVINIQFKLLFGLFLLIAFASPISNFIDQYIVLMFTEFGQALKILATV